MMSGAMEITSVERALGMIMACGIGPFVKARRIELHMTQVQLASRARMSIGTIRDIGQDRTFRPRLGSLARLAAALDLRASAMEQCVLHLPRAKSAQASAG